MYERIFAGIYAHIDGSNTYTISHRFAIEIVNGIRKRVGPNFIIIYRLSLLDLVEGGSTWDEVCF